MKVLITELIWENGIKEIQKAGYSIDYDKEIGRSREKLLDIISEYDALIVRNETIVDTELLEKAVNLKVIGRLGVGLDNIDLPAARDRNIKLVVAKNANATSVAEYVMAAMMDASRNILEATKDVRKGNWNRKLFTGMELSGKTLGLFGLGEISNRVAKRANAFGMRVIGYDPFVNSYDYILSENGVKQVHSITELLVHSDFISIHVPLTNETRSVINEETLALMKRNAYIINSSRGGIINEADLYHAIKNNRILGAYLDVLEVEPIQPDSPLLSLDAIKLTPHVAGLTEESQERISMLVAVEVIKVLEGKYSLCTI